MLTVLSGAFLSYFGTTSDYFVMLLAIFGKHKKSRCHRRIFIGELIGNGILIAVSLLMAYLLKFIPESWILGLLGLFPIAVGLKTFFSKEDEAAKAKASDAHLIRDVVLMTLTTCSADNLAIYVPFFSSVSFSYLPMILIVFLLVLSIVSLTALKMTKFPLIRGFLNRYADLFQLVVYVFLGVMIMWESGTMRHLLSML
ncbi:MAG: cadmium resistance transporter [Oenococcus sp.]|uniref:cadmium resistance transporter n=1 Tax=Oenococcus TaxID=46254 RepID=UPI0021E8D46A|nr:cadmium resistance transporter [Oenococcus kitaharae]MCV3296466.1 cadmium resistance transporter [Oenococcus kitaharae]